MKKRKLMSGLLTAILSVTMMAPSFSVFAETSEAGTPKEDKTAEMTVKVEGNGNISFKEVSEKASDDTKKLLDEKKLPEKDKDGKDIKEVTFSYPEGESLTIHLEGESEKASFKDGDEDSKDIQLKKEDGKDTTTGDITILAKDKKTVTVSFPEKETKTDDSANKVSTQATTPKAVSAPKAQAASTQKVATQVNSSKKSGSGRANAYGAKRGHPSTAKFKITSGPLKGAVVKGHCTDPGTFLPGTRSNNKVYNYKFTKSGNKAHVTFKCASGHWGQDMSGTYTYPNPKPTKLKIKKVSAKTNCTNGNSSYSLSGTQYTVYGKAGKKNKIGTLTTNASGDSNTLTISKTIKKGKSKTVFVYETKAGKGMTTFDKDKKDRSKTPYKIKVGGETTKTFTASDYPKLDPLFITVKKKDARPGDKRKYSMKGAIFSVTFYGDDSSRKKVKQTWKFQTKDDSGIIELNQRYAKSYLVSGKLETGYDGKIGFPIGYYTVKEEHAPDGFREDPTPYKITLTTNGVTGSGLTTAKNELIINEYQARGDVKFQKVGETTTIDENENVNTTQNRLANCKFTLTYKGSKGDESHTIWTDEKGEFDSSKLKNTNNTNRGEQGDGIFFGEDEDTVSDSLGALPEGKYELKEERCEANEKFNLIDPVTFSITQDKKTINLGTLVDPETTLKTTLTGEEGEKLIYGKGEITLKDTVEYKDLDTTKEYEIQGTLMDKSTGKKALDKDGNEIKSEKVKFTPENPDGTVEVTFKFDGTGVVMGKEFVAFENLYHDGKLFGVHASLEDSSQTVGFPEIKTQATATDTGINIVPGSDKVELTDTVSYKGLIAGKTYKAKVWAVDKDGKTIKGTESEREIVANSESGTYDMPITLDNPADFAGKDIVLYEELYMGGKLIADHKDASDKDQTIHISKLKTRAINKDSGMNILADGVQTIIDTVDYENLVPGQEYTGRAWLVDESGNKIEGTEVEKNFKPSEANGSFDMELTFDAGKRESSTVDSPDTDEDGNEAVDVTNPDEDDDDKDTAGATDGNVTVFEEVYLKDSLVGEHKDVGDSDQTLYRPGIHTTATGEKTGAHIVSGVGEQVIEDKIEYTGLAKGKEHTAKTWLVDSEGNKIDGTDVETKFTPEETKGSVTVKIPFDAEKLAGKNVTVFEEVYLDGRLVGEHKDLTDEGQTVRVSKVETTATSDALWTNNVPAKGVQKLRDTVTYENLPAGEKLTVKTWAVEKESGEKASEVETKEFTPEKDLGEDEDIASDDSDASDETANSEDKDVADKEDADKDSEDADADKSDDKDKDASENEVTVNTETSGGIETFCKVDTDKYRGKHLVIFEEIYNQDGKLVGEHKNVEDGLQTVAVPDLGTKASVKKSLKNIIKPSGTTEVTDTMSYTNLMPGNYEVYTYLVDKKTGKKVSDTKMTQFTVGKTTNADETTGNDAVSGTFTVTGLKVDGSKLAGKDLVVFEEIRVKVDGEKDGQFVVEHKDVNDEAQTVHVNNPNNPPSTGDHSNMFWWLLILAGVVAGASGYGYAKHRKSKK